MDKASDGVSAVINSVYFVFLPHRKKSLLTASVCVSLCMLFFWLFMGISKGVVVMSLSILFIFLSHKK